MPRFLPLKKKKKGLASVFDKMRNIMSASQILISVRMTGGSH